MRIEELILEGFKSYPVRTQITGWDPSFNAITGLNGSGKSNILDAICFVLGLTNMSSVRVLDILSSTYPLTMSPLLRCVRKINRISSISVVRPASPRHRSPSCLITQTGKVAHLEWRTALRSQSQDRCVAMPPNVLFLSLDHPFLVCLARSLFQISPNTS